jgi:hypothetical protein
MLRDEQRNRETEKQTSNPCTDWTNRSSYTNRYEKSQLKSVYCCVGFPVLVRRGKLD